MYKQTIRPVLFLMEPEKVHALLVSCLKCYRHLPWCRCWIRHLYTCSDKQLIWNHLTFRNRIGLSAGFDKGAEIFDELADYGFGFIEVGTVTPVRASIIPDWMLLNAVLNRKAVRMF